MEHTNHANCPPLHLIVYFRFKTAIGLPRFFISNFSCRGSNENGSYYKAVKEYIFLTFETSNNNALLIELETPKVASRMERRQPWDSHSKPEFTKEVKHERARECCGVLAYLHCKKTATWIPYQAAVWDHHIAASKEIAIEVKSMIFENCNNEKAIITFETGGCAILQHLTETAPAIKHPKCRH